MTQPRFFICTLTTPDADILRRSEIVRRGERTHLDIYRRGIEAFEAEPEAKKTVDGKAKKMIDGK